MPHADDDEQGEADTDRAGEERRGAAATRLSERRRATRLASATSPATTTNPWSTSSASWPGTPGSIGGPLKNWRATPLRLGSPTGWTQKPADPCWNCDRAAISHGVSSTHAAPAASTGRSRERSWARKIHAAAPSWAAMAKTTK